MGGSKCHETFSTATSAAAITAPDVRSAYAAGKLSIGFRDHWVPGANKTSTDLVNDWAAKARGSDRLSRLASLDQTRATSDLPPATDIVSAGRQVRFVPEADSCTAANVFNHLGGKDCRSPQQPGYFTFILLPKIGIFDPDPR